MRTEGGIEALVLAGTELALLRGVDDPVERLGGE
jgi:hypothetical protein